MFALPSLFERMLWLGIAAAFSALDFRKVIPLEVIYRCLLYILYILHDKLLVSSEYGRGTNYRICYPNIDLLDSCCS